MASEPITDNILIEYYKPNLIKSINKLCGNPTGQLYGIEGVSKDWGDIVTVSLRGDSNFIKKIISGLEKYIAGKILCCRIGINYVYEITLYNDFSINEFDGSADIVLSITSSDFIFYKEYLMDPFKIKDHFNTTRLFKCDTYINAKLINQHESNFKVRVLDSTYNKIKILRELEKKFNIKKLDVEYKTKGDINLLDTEYELIKKVFRYNTKNKPTTYDTFKLLYVDMIKSITNKDIIINTRKRNGAVKISNYSLNMEYINNQLILNKFYNPDLKGYCPDFNLLLNLTNTDIISNNKDTSLLDQKIFLD